LTDFLHIYIYCRKYFKIKCCIQQANKNSDVKLGCHCTKSLHKIC